MRKIGYFLLMGLVPLLAGVLYAFSLGIPAFSTLLFVAIPWALAILWLLLGRRCGLDGYGYFWSIFSGHWAVFQILLCAIWQWGFTESGVRNMTLAVYSQLLVGLVPGTLQLVAPFCEVDGAYMTQLFILWGTLASAVGLLLIFSVGFWLGRRKRKEYEGV